MINLSERMAVRCPDHEASAHLAAFVDEHSLDNGRIRVALRLPVTLARERRTPLERRVVATLFPLRSVTDAHPTYSVTWASVAAGPVPEFTGALAVETSTAGDGFGLVVSGCYEPPYGAESGAFDAALGHRIARAAARDLMRTIAEFVQNRVAHNQAARAGHVTRRPAIATGELPPARAERIYAGTALSMRKTSSAALAPEPSATG